MAEVPVEGVLARAATVANDTHSRGAQRGEQLTGSAGYAHGVLPEVLLAFGEERGNSLARRPRQPACQGHVLASCKLGRAPHGTLDFGGVLAAVPGDEALDNRAVGVVEKHAIRVQRDEADLLQFPHSLPSSLTH
jgi:hypothetical protein